MRVALVAVNQYEQDPRAKVLTDQLRAAEHDVSVVRYGDAQSENGVVARSQPTGTSPFKRLTRRYQSVERRNERRHNAFIDATVATGATLIHPTTSDALDVAIASARRLGSAVARAPKWPDAGDVDLIWRAPSEPALSQPLQPGLPFHTPDHDRGPYRPEPGRHQGLRIALAYRKTDSNPGRYLEAAMLRSGIAVDLFDDGIDFDNLHPNTTAVVFVEAPYPALPVRGKTPDIPIAFWVHHGEHRLATNLRLAERYRADLILLAHSWHLAHFFRQPVQRFPFGMAPELFPEPIPMSARKYDAAMVGRHIRGGGPYPFRGELTQQLAASLGPTLFEEAVTPTRMAEIYGQSRIVPNEGGSHHFPITMRVLEAIGAGSLLVTQPVPGLDQILEPAEHFIQMEDDFIPQFQQLLANHDKIQEIALSARRHVMGQHLYDHRVDELLMGLDATSKTPPRATNTEADPLVTLIDDDVDVQRLLVAPGTELETPGRELWIDIENPSPAKYDAVVFRGKVPSENLLAGARRFIYADTHNRADLDLFVASLPGKPEVTSTGSLLRVALQPGSESH